MHTFFMTPNATHAPSQSTQADYLIAISSNSEKRPTSYLIKCPIMRYCGLTLDLTAIPRLATVITWSCCISVHAQLAVLEHVEFSSKVKKMLSLLRKVCKFPFFQKQIKQKILSISP